jgi:hypothetical protein
VAIEESALARDYQPSSFLFMFDDGPPPPPYRIEGGVPKAASRELRPTLTRADTTCTGCPLTST